MCEAVIGKKMKNIRDSLVLFMPHTVIVFIYIFKYRHVHLCANIGTYK